MDIFMALLLFAAMIAIVVGVVLLIIQFVRKKSKYIPIVIGGIGIVLFAISYTYFSVITNNSSSGAATQSSNTQSSKITDSSINKFNKPVVLTNSSEKVRMEIENVQQVDPNDDSVVDVSSNYKQTHQYVVVNYKVTALSKKVNLDDFDGYNLHLYDGKGESSIASSNRDTDTPEHLYKGDTQVMEIGEGLRNNSNRVTIHFAGQTWKGSITK